MCTLDEIRPNISDPSNIPSFLWGSNADAGRKLGSELLLFLFDLCPRHIPDGIAERSIFNVRDRENITRNFHVRLSRLMPPLRKLHFSVFTKPSVSAIAAHLLMIWRHSGSKTALFLLLFYPFGWPVIRFIKNVINFRIWNVTISFCKKQTELQLLTTPLLLKFPLRGSFMFYFTTFAGF